MTFFKSISQMLIEIMMYGVEIVNPSEFHIGILIRTCGSYFLLS